MKILEIQPIYEELGPIGTRAWRSFDPCVVFRATILRIQTPKPLVLELDLKFISANLKSESGCPIEQIRQKRSVPTRSTRTIHRSRFSARDHSFCGLIQSRLEKYSQPLPVGNFEFFWMKFGEIRKKSGSFRSEMVSKVNGPKPKFYSFDVIQNMTHTYD